LNAQNPLSFVDDNFTATRIVNNKIAYIYPASVLTTNTYYAVLFRGEDNRKAQEANSAPTDAEYRTEDKDSTNLITQNSPLGYVAINSKYGEEEGDTLPRVETLEEYRDKLVVLDFDKLKNPPPFFYGADEGNADPGSPLDFLWQNQVAADTAEAQDLSSSSETDIDVAGNIGYTVCHHSPTLLEGGGAGYVFGFFEDSTEGRNHRIFVRKVCSALLDNINRIEREKNQIIGSVLGKASEQRESIYKQMHTLFHQWQTLAYSDKRNSSGCIPENLDEDNTLAKTLEDRFGSNHRNMLDGEYIEVDGVVVPIEGDGDSEAQDGTFIYDYPLQRIRGIGSSGPIRVRDSIINLEPLYKPNANTTVLNIIQQVCTKNNFLFIPIPGNPGYLNVKDIYSPSREPANIVIRNFFHVLFTPTPESRAKVSNKDAGLSLNNSHKEYRANSFSIKYGHPDNQIVSNIQVGTDDNKVTAESIVNLQRLVDNENQNKKVTTDCSMLPVLAGRSYKASVDMLGNAQVYPMQFFFLENSPLFGGLYQVMKVKHSIVPNDMKTSVEGIRMRFSPGDGYGAVEPITLQTFEALDAPNSPLNIKKGFDASDRARLLNPDGAPVEGSDATFGSIIDEGDNVPVGGYSKNRIEAAVKKKGHKWFDQNGDYELNIVGIKNTQTGSEVTNKFDDYITLSYKVNGEWKFWSWPATTQPGKTWMLKPMNPKGTAILKPGQYINSHAIGKHAGQYEALRQVGNLSVYRDGNKDLNYDQLSSKIDTGPNFGVNIHRSSENGESVNVNDWSAGCQVFKRGSDFKTFMKICRQAKALHGNKFTYTLIESKDIS
jgi:hypothetical protein